MEFVIAVLLYVGREDTSVPTMTFVQVVLKVSCPQPRVVGISRRPVKPRIRPGLQRIAKIAKVPDNRRWALLDSEEHRRAAARSGEDEATLLSRMQARV